MPDLFRLRRKEKREGRKNGGFDRRERLTDVSAIPELKTELKRGLKRLIEVEKRAEAWYNIYDETARTKPAPEFYGGQK